MSLYQQHLHYREIPDMADDMINDIQAVLKDIPNHSGIDTHSSKSLKLLEPIAE